MRTKNAKSISAAERAHMALVKAMPCSVCGCEGPSEAHHIRQGDHFSTVALCADCHTGPFNGIHGQRRIWAVLKMDELAALVVTYRRLLESRG